MRWVLVIIALACCAPVASTAAPVNAAAKLELRLISTVEASSHTDRPPKGDGVGDVYRFRSVLRNARPQFGKPTGAVVGRDWSTFTLTSATAATVTVRVELPGGTLHVEGRSVGGATTLRVTGRTGRYAGATGTVTGRDLPDGRSTNNYHLVLP